MDETIEANTVPDAEITSDSPPASGSLGAPLLDKVIAYDKKRYWDMIKNLQELPFDELLSKYGYDWVREPFLNEEGETLAHAYAVYGVIPENGRGGDSYIYDIWGSVFLMKSSVTGKTVFEVAFANHTVPDVPFYELFTGENEDDVDIIRMICPEAINFSLADMVNAFKQYAAGGKDNPPEVQQAPE